MKIESLSFKNINSLKGEHQIHFDQSPLNSGGLFAIIGPTGSGKSTLLDAICLALYGRTPRISTVNKGKIEQDGSILTKHQTEAYAKVKFTCNAGIFESTWSISTNRNGNLREYEMNLTNLKNKSSFSEKKSEVLSEIERLVGLSYDQFVKSVLLSQGEFATLLQSNEKERSELLEKITNTSIYRQIGIKVYEKYKGLDAKISEQKTVLKDLNEKLLDQEKLQDMQAQNAELELTEKKQQKTLLQYGKDLEQFATKEKLDQELKTELDTLLKLTNAFDEFQNNNNEKLKLHAKTLDFEEELLNFNTLAEKQDTQRQNLARITSEKYEIEKAIASSKVEIKRLLKKEVNDLEVEAQLNDFLKTYQALSKEREIKRNAYKSKKELLNKELEVLGLTFHKQSILEFKSRLETQLKTSEQEIDRLDIELKPTEPLEETLKTKHQLLSRLKEAKHEDKSIKELKERIDKLDIQLKNESDELLKFPKLISDQEVKLLTAEKDVKHLETEKENQTLRLEVENLRKKLTQNEACPVCGSTHHPFADHSPAVDSELDKKLKAAKQTQELTSHELARLKAENSSISKRIDELENELQAIKRSLKSKQNAFEVDYSSVLSQLNGNSLKECETRIENYINQLEKFKTLDKDIKALKSSISSIEELENIENQGSELKAKLDGLYQGKDLDNFVSNLKSTWVRLNSNLISNQTSIQKEKETLITIEEQLEKLQENLEAQIKSSAFSSIAVANACRMKSADYQVKVKKQQELSERLQIQKEKINGIKKQLNNLKFECFTEKNEAKSAIALLKEKVKNTKTELEEVNRQLKNNSDRKERIKEIEERIAKDLKANKKWELLNQLIGDAEGHKFNKFAQDLSLQNLILLGNKRLKVLNSRYELDRYISGEDRNQLYIIDHDMGGERRSVKTLSGGETFLISLAMALGLSDLASKHVEINSLFIDEGFGTLDPETLDLTLDTLERLQAESNKTIGIISHVGALKERIQTQIVLNRNAQGYSQLNILS